MTEEEKNYKKIQTTRMKSYIVGGKDNMGNIISKIFSKGDEYMIYEIKTKELSDSLKIIIDTQKEIDTVPLERFYQVRQKFTQIKGLLYKVIDNIPLKVRISHILSHAITGNSEEANTQFDELIDEINTEYKNQFKHRLKYLLTTMTFMTICIIASIIVYSWSILTDLPQIRNLIFICSSASIGGFLSITRRLKATVFEKDIDSSSYIIYGIERMVIALLAGVIIYFAINSNLIFGIIKELDKPIFGYLIFSVVAGFSETLIPNLLIKLEKKEK